MRSLLVLVTLVLASYSVHAAPQTYQKETEVRVSEHTRFKISAGWSFDAKLFKLVSPEGDVTVYLMEKPYAKDLESLSTTTWKEIQPQFARKIIDRSSPPPKDGWDEMHTFYYETSAKEEKVIVTEARVFKERAYLMLIEASHKGYEKRSSQLNIVKETWRPSDLKPEDLSQSKPKTFTPEHAVEMDRFIVQAMKDLQIPGAAVGLVQAGKIVYRRGFGVKKLGSADKVTEDTLFMIGSTTKPLTTLMLAKLVEAGKMSWETPIQKLLPAFTLADKARAAKFQMKHAACACTGMPRADYALLLGKTDDTLESSLRHLASMKPITGFGETFQYSNQLVSIGGMAGALAYNKGADTFQKFENAMQDLVFSPLGMQNTRVRPKASDAERLASPHAEDFTGRMASFPQNLDDFAYAVAPAGSVWSNIDDMAQYIMMELNEGKTAGGAEFISSMQLMKRRAPGVKVSESVSYGLGLFIENAQGLTTISHGGNTLGFTADMMFLPEPKIGLVVLINAGDIHSFKRAIRQKIFEQLLGAKERAQSLIDYSQKTRQESVIERTRLISIKVSDLAWIQDYVGHYENPSVGRISIEKQRDGYYLKTDRWESLLGSVAQDEKEKVLALVSPPWSGTMALRVKSGPSQALIFEDESEFVRVK